MATRHPLLSPPMTLKSGARQPSMYSWLNPRAPGGPPDAPVPPGRAAPVEPPVHPPHPHAARGPAPHRLRPLGGDEAGPAQAGRPQLVGLGGWAREVGRPQVHGPLVQLLQARGPVLVHPGPDLRPEVLELGPEIELHGNPQPVRLP